MKTEVPSRPGNGNFGRCTGGRSGGRRCLKRKGEAWNSRPNETCTNAFRPVHGTVYLSRGRDGVCVPSTGRNPFVHVTFRPPEAGSGNKRSNVVEHWVAERKCGSQGLRHHADGAGDEESVARNARKWWSDTDGQKRPVHRTGLYGTVYTYAAYEGMKGAH